MIHNLITYTILRINHLKFYKNTFTIAKSPPKRLENQSNQRTSIQRHVKVKRPKKLQQKSSWKAKSIKVNAIMYQLNKSDVNVYQIKKQHQSPHTTI